MYSLSLDSNELKDLLKCKMRQSYVEKYIQKPFIDTKKIEILNELFDHVDLPLQEKKQQIITIMLVQIALDTHERIPQEKVSLMAETEKQLSVLAGDYYSGLYYLLLAELDNIEMIQLLAYSIKRINEQKMTLFYQDVNTFTELTTILSHIEAQLFTDVAQAYHHEPAFIELIEEVLLVHRLSKELTIIKQQKDSDIFLFFQKDNPNINDTEVIRRTEDEIHQRKLKVDHLVSVLPPKYHVGQLVPQPSCNTILEER